MRGGDKDDGGRQSHLGHEMITFIAIPFHQKEEGPGNGKAGRSTIVPLRWVTINPDSAVTRDIPSCVFVSCCGIVCHEPQPGVYIGRYLCSQQK